MLRSKRVRIMAGPNGSGKSTVLKAVYSQFYSGLFVNADEIKKSFKSIGFINLLGDFNLEVNDTASFKALRKSLKS